MKTLRRLVFVVLFSPLAAFAHPGHDGDHELVWDVDHFARHPLATLACAALVTAAGWAVWHLVQTLLAAKPERVRSRTRR